MHSTRTQCRWRYSGRWLACTLVCRCIDRLIDPVCLLAARPVRRRVRLLWRLFLALDLLFLQYVLCKFVESIILMKGGNGEQIKTTVSAIEQGRRLGMKLC